MNSGGDQKDEDASELKFPKEFEAISCDALLNSEVFMLLDHRKKESESKEEIEDMNELFVSTLTYTQRFSKFKQRESIRAVRGIFTGRSNLHKFEVAQLANLCPETADEAKSLIPSLESKLQDDDLDEILKSLNNKKSFQ